MNTYLPISFSIKNRRCLIVGAGEVALRKIGAMLNYGCGITVVAPEAVDRIEGYARRGSLALEKRPYASPEGAEYDFVIAACRDRDVNRTVAADCAKARVLVNVVDAPELCSFIFPAVVRRDNLTIAVSTDGQSPFLSVVVRAAVERAFPKHWSVIAGHAATFRRQVRERWPNDPEKRSACYGRFAGVDWDEMLRHDSEEVAKALSGMLEG